ncbi:MAG: MFS transporter [Pelagibacteraceae bacterium]|nr:MFS transporter [Pelagibacteraceae bacterium]MCI5078953.1 MFS transporter [Pelagibacteraceae bacterium]
MKKYIYGLFDIANSPFQVLIISLIFSPYFANQIVGDPQIGSAYWQWTVGLCAIVVSIVGIKLGSFSDQIKGGRRNFFYISTLLCIFSTFFLWSCAPGTENIFKCLAIFFIANFFYELCQMFYNSYLFDFSEKNNRGFVSGLGFALGFIAIIPLLLLLINLFILPEQTFLNLDKSQFEHVRVVPVVVAIWFLIFSIPIFAFIQFTEPRPVTKKEDVQPLLSLVYHEKKITNLGNFLIARLFYADAIIAIQISFAIFTVKVLGLTVKEIFQLVIITSVIQALGSFIGGLLNDKIGSKLLIQYSLYVVLFAIIGLVSFQERTIFIIIFQIGAFFFGILQSASRVFMTSFVSQSNLGQGFGLFTLASRSTAILGPIMVGTITYFTSLDVGFLSIVVLVLAGIIMLRRVDVPKSY